MDPKEGTTCLAQGSHLQSVDFCCMNEGRAVSGEWAGGGKI